MAIFKNNRCKVCKKNRGHRFCLRLGKDICWHDCNELRIDTKCPEACRYAFSQVSDFEFRTNADSALEYGELLKLQIDLWVLKAQPALAGRVPVDVAETEAGQIELLKMFEKASSVPGFPTEYLKKKLKLKKLVIPEVKADHESVAKEFLNTIIKQDWEKIQTFMFNMAKFDDREIYTNFMNRFKADKVISKMTEFNLISAGLAGNKDQAFVYVECNNKFEMTLVLKKENEQWKIASRVYGKPELINGEMDAVQQIALMLSANRLSDVFELLKKYSAIYVDSADIQYYNALYYLIQHNHKKARPFLLNSVEMDPDFAVAAGLFATVMVQEGNLERGKELYINVLKNDPEDVKSMNNLASIYIQEENFEEARRLLEKALKLAPEFEYAQKNLDRINSK